MNWDAVGAVAEILGAVVVIATLIFLSRQIQQSNKIAQGQAMRDIVGQFNDSMQRWTDSPETIPLMQRGMTDYASLGKEERAHFAFRIAPLINQFDLMLRLHRDGQFPNDMLEDFAAICISIITTPGGKQYWEDVSKTFHSAVVEYLNATLESGEVRQPVTNISSFWRAEGREYDGG